MFLLKVTITECFIFASPILSHSQNNRIINAGGGNMFELRHEGLIGENFFPAQQKENFIPALLAMAFSPEQISG